jgi:UDPglucose 6-dehydrogenase
MAVAQKISQAYTGYAAIVAKSTVPVGTDLKIKQAVLETNPNFVFDIASNPEFMHEGAAIDDFMRSDRIVAGVNEITCDTLIIAVQVLSKVNRQANGVRD